jgi:lipopolysaccharide/colanic/teichoic acid biosynthesis glycosyltransferase
MTLANDIITPYPSPAKRAFDLFAATLGLVILSPVLLAVAFLIKLTSRGPIFFTQVRVGRNFRPFRIYKFRTMVPAAPSLAGALTVGEDSRITWIGRWLRKAKIDELPQLLNILKGDMSLVGPRPEVPRYVEMFRQDYEEILRVRPGLTDVASLKYRDEARILGEAPDPEQSYIHYVLPDKIRLAKEYLGRASFFSDLGLILATVSGLLGVRLWRAQGESSP